MARVVSHSLSNGEVTDSESRDLIMLHTGELSKCQAVMPHIWMLFLISGFVLSCWPSEITAASASTLPPQLYEAVSGDGLPPSVEAAVSSLQDRHLRSLWRVIYV